MLLAKISKEYKRLSIDEIKLNLLYFVNNSQATKETKAYNKKFLNYLFRK